MKTWVIVPAKKWQGNEQCNRANQKYMAEGFSLVPQGKIWIDLINSVFKELTEMQIKHALFGYCL